MRGGKKAWVYGSNYALQCLDLTGRRPTTRQINIQEIYIKRIFQVFKQCLYFAMDCKWMSWPRRRSMPRWRLPHCSSCFYSTGPNLKKKWKWCQNVVSLGSHNTVYEKWKKCPNIFHPETIISLENGRRSTGRQRLPPLHQIWQSTQTLQSEVFGQISKLFFSALMAQILGESFRKSINQNGWRQQRSWIQVSVQSKKGKLRESS